MDNRAASPELEQLREAIAAMSDVLAALGRLHATLRRMLETAERLGR